METATIPTIQPISDSARAAGAPRALVIRFGAIGDVIMASSVMAGLKRQGFHVTADVQAKGAHLLRCDPNVDAVQITPDDMPADGAQMQAHWASRSVGFDRVVNLVDIIESTLLKNPVTVDFYWNDEMRRRFCGGFNYVEACHWAAEIPYEGTLQRFYPSPDEDRFARSFKAANSPLLMFALAGGWRHKIYPWAPALITRLMSARPDLHIAVAGAEKDADMARSLADHLSVHVGPSARRRFHGMVGTHDIRDVMALARHADMVVGPETGLLNAVAIEPMPKVVMLSHSNVTNLTRDWVSTVSISPKPGTAPCHPCHRLHPEPAQHCPRFKETEFAACAAGITVESMLAAILAGLPASDAQKFGEAA